MPDLDRYAPFVLSAFAITSVVLGSYVLYLRSRLRGLQQALASAASRESSAHR